MGFPVDAITAAQPLIIESSPDPEPLLVDGDQGQAAPAAGEEPTLFSNGRWLLITAAVAPWVGLALFKLFTRTPATPEQMLMMMQGKADAPEARFL